MVSNANLKKDGLHIGSVRKIGLNQAEKDYFKIYNKSTGLVSKISYREFLCNSVACEMEPTNHEEALKAQIVAAYTYFCNVREKQNRLKNLHLKGADFEVESDARMYYMGEEQLKKRWGKDYESNRKKILNCVESVYKEALKKDGKYIEALYHSISGGATENITDVFGGSCECLVSVASPFDKFAPGYMSQKVFSTKEIDDILKASFKGITLNEAFETLFEIKERTKSGMVKKVRVGNKEFTGREIRSAFGLRSSNFDIAYRDGQFIFTVYGYGHGVGLSQYGAQAMAEQGADYKEILKWYYKGTEIVKD